MHRWRSTLKRSPARCAASLLALAAAAPHAAPVKTEHVSAELVAERQAVQPGQSILVGLRLQHAPHWHTYWRNPGEAGLPTRLTLALPPGATAGEIDWPAPRKLQTGPLVSSGYEGELLLPLRFTAPADARPGAVLVLRAEAAWLVCKDVCIPENVSLALDLPVADAPAAPGAQAALFADTAQAQAAPMAGWTVDAQHAGRDVLLTLDRDVALGPADAPPIDVFTYEKDVFEAARQDVVRTATGYAVKLSLAGGATLPDRLTGIAVAPVGAPPWGSGKRTGEFSATLRQVAAITPPVPAGAATPGTASAGIGAAAPLGLFAALAMALVGGMVLNLMPCVFPVLSIKLLSLASQDRQRGALRTHAAAYSAGVVASFVALAAGLLALRAAGQAVGWGFQLQEPGVVFGLALLFFGLGLNLLGAFEFGGGMPQRLAAWRSKRPAGDAFACGMVTVVAASPCTAPFMGAALGFAITQSAGAALAVFAALGVGLALPYAVLVLAPGWRRALPRPGAWMNRLKQGLAFPMFATVVWLLWVLGQQVGLDAAVKALVSLLGLAFLAWVAGLGGASGTAAKALGVAAVGALLVWSWPTAPDAADGRGFQAAAAGGGSVQAGAAGGRGIEQSAADGPWRSYDDAALAALVAANKPVFVDFTAAWCVSCQVNKRMVLHRDETMQAFAAAGVTLMRADWTHRDARITAALARLGRNGVPVYVLMRPGREPVLLPEILTRALVREALATL